METKIRSINVHSCRKQNKYVGPYCRAEMYAGHIACCHLVSHDEYALHILLTLEKKMRETTGRTPDRCIMLTA